jgi:hypothetical protein
LGKVVVGLIGFTDPVVPVAVEDREEVLKPLEISGVVPLPMNAKFAAEHAIPCREEAADAASVQPIFHAF